MGQKQSVQEPEPLYSTKRYTTDELNHLLENATKVTFTHSAEFRDGGLDRENDTYLKASLVNLQQEGKVYYEASFEDKEQFRNVRASQSIPSENIPFTAAAVIKQAFMHWDFMDQPNSYLKAVHIEFIKQVNGAFLELLTSLNSLGINNSQKLEKISEILDAKAEFRTPSLVYDSQMLLIAFITALTTEKYYDEAKAIHQFIQVYKKIVHIQTDLEERKKAAVLVAPVLLEGLHLQRAWEVAGHVLERSQRERFFRLFFASTFNLTVRHPVFDEDYDKATYELYGQVDKKCKQVGLGVGVSPAFAPRDLPDFFLDDLKAKYSEIVAVHFPSDASDAKRAVFYFFTNKIASVAAFDPDQTRAQAMHDFLYLLKLVYQEDDAKEKNVDLYAKVIRQFLQIPNLNGVVDPWFDKMAVSCILQRKRSFKEPFNIGLYKVSPEDQQRYCARLTQEYQVRSQENSALRVRLQEDIQVKESQEEEIMRLKRELHQVQDKLSAMSLVDLGESSPLSISPPSTPPSTPPTGRLHFPHLHSRSSEGSPPSRRKLSNPQKPSAEKSPPKERKLSDPDVPESAHSKERKFSDPEKPNADRSPPKERKMSMDETPLLILPEGQQSPSKPSVLRTLSSLRLGRK